jgi:S1-C subfamily serine protease
MGYWVLDIVLGLVLLGYLVSGLRRGFTRSLGAVLGLVVGAVAAFFLVPLAGGFIADSSWRTVGSIVLVIALLIAGHALGSGIGRSIARRFEDTPLRVIDRILGAAVNVVIAALVISLVSASVSSLGVPLLSQATGQSVVISTINRWTPTPVKSFLARVRSAAVTDGIPSIVEALGGVTSTPDLPDIDTESDALQAASRSVVRVSGNAFACGQSQSGTGFVIAPDRVVTNAHVLAGVTEPVVEARSGDVLAGTVVYFDPIDDLAVIAVDDLSAPALDLAPPLLVDAEGVYQGYPYGGPFTTGPAEVLAVGTENVEDIYGASASPRAIYTIAADIQQGDSGGPFLTLDGTVAGVVFAKSANTPNLGYAMTNAELEPIVSGMPDFVDRVGTGTCIDG